jgi:hypothetical protein
LIDGRFVECTAHQPSFVAITVEVALAKVFQPNQAFVSVVKVNLRHTNSMIAQKVRNGYIMAILFPFPIVFYQNERLLRRALDAIEFAVRSTFLNYCDFDLGDI